MSFMQPDIQHAEFFIVETDVGSECVPADIVTLGFAVNFFAEGIYDEDSPLWVELHNALYPYVEGNNITEVSPRIGWIARLSAPGYMDRTDWSWHDSKQEAIDYLDETYGNAD